MLALIELLIQVVGFVALLFVGWSALPDAKKAQFTNWITNWTLAALTGVTALLGQGEALLAPIATAFLNAFNTYGGPIATELRAPIAGFVQEELNVVTAGLVANGESTPDNAVGIASAAMADAFGFGLSSAAVTAAFEALFPEKLNVLNGAGPMIAKFAGFDEVAAAVRDPLYANAFGKSLDYHFRSLFKPDLPNEADAVTWHARRLLTDAQLQQSSTTRASNRSTKRRSSRAPIARCRRFSWRARPKPARSRMRSSTRFCNSTASATRTSRR